MSTHRKGIRFSIAHLIFISFCLYWFLWLAKGRLIARDEGFYTLAARLLMEGNTLYADFFFPQGPASAVLLGHFFTLSSHSWDAARVWAALLATGASACVWLYCVRCYTLLLGILACLLLISCNIYFVWLPTAQTYAPAAFFLLLSCTLILRDPSGRSHLALLFGGVCLALAALSRLYLAALFLPLFLLVLCTTKTDRMKASLHLLLGFCMPLVVFLFSYSEHLEALWFNLFEYHLIRSDSSLLDSMPQKLQILKIITGLTTTAKFESNQIAYLCWFFLLTSSVRFLKGKCVSTWFVMSLSVLLVSLVPSPAYVQYFCLLVPFLVITIVDDLAYLARNTELFSNPVVIALPALLAFTFYIRSVPDDIKRYTRTGKGVIGIYNAQAASIWNTRYVRRVSNQLDKKTKTPGTVFAYWPGFLLESKHQILPGFENHFALRVANKLSASEREQFHVASSGRLQDEIKGTRLKGLLLDPKKTKQPLKDELLRSGFKQDTSIRFPLVFLRSDGTIPYATLPAQHEEFPDS